MFPFEIKGPKLEQKFIRALIFTLVLVQMVSIGGQLILHQMSLEENLKNSSKLTVGLLARMIEVPLGEFNIPEVEQLVRDVTREKLIKYTIVYDNQGEKIFTVGTSDGSNTLVLKQEVFSSVRGVKIGLIELGVNKENLDSDATHDILISILGALSLGVAIMFTIKHLFAKLVLQPLASLSTFAKERANLTRLEGVHEDDEFGQLFKAMTAMTREINHHTHNLEIQVENRTSELVESNQALNETIAQLKLTQDQLINSSKLAALGKLSAGIAHEINNPLAVISGYAVQLSRLDYSALNSRAPDVLKKLHTMERMVQRISGIIEGMKTFSRTEDTSKPFSKVPLASLIHESVELAQIKFKNSVVQLLCDSIPEVEIECRHIQISQIIINLLSNSYDAVVALDRPWVRLAVEVDHPAQKIKIRISDSGKGIPESIAHRLMEPFFTTKAVGSGTGLGLSISLGIAHSHNGNLELDRHHPTTCFILTLPLLQAEAPSDKSSLVERKTA